MKFKLKAQKNRNYLKHFSFYVILTHTYGSCHVLFLSPSRWDEVPPLFCHPSSCRMCFSERRALPPPASKLGPVPTIEEAHAAYVQASKPSHAPDPAALLGVSPLGAVACVLFALLTLAHAAFLSVNGSYMELHIPLRGKMIVTKSSAIGTALLWGLFISSSLFLWRQWRFTSALDALAAREADLRLRLAQREYQLARLQTAAKKIAVPYRLDALVDQNLTDFSDYSDGTKKVLRAGGGST